MIDRPPVAFGFVDKIEAHDCAVRDLQNLQKEIEVALEVIGVDDDNSYIGFAEQNEVASDFFVCCRREQRVGSRKIH